MTIGTVITSTAEEFKYVISTDATNNGVNAYGALIATISKGQVMLGQTSSVDMESLASNEKVMQQVIAESGHGFPGFSRSNDLYIATADILSVAEESSLSPSRLRLPPAGEAPVYMISDCPALPADGLLGRLQPFSALPAEDMHFGIIGHDIQDPQARISIITKDSRPEQEGGHGEGKFLFVGGRSGSRKTIEALKVICLTLAKNPAMGFLSIDPKGELYDSAKFVIQEGVKEFRHYDLMHSEGANEAEAIELRQIRLTDPDILVRQLRRYFSEGIKLTDSKEASKSLAAAEEFSKSFMTDRGRLIPSEFRACAFNEEALAVAARSGYANTDSRDANNAADRVHRNFDTRVTERIRDDIIAMFTGSETDTELLEEVAKNGRRVFLRFDPSQDAVVVKATVASFMQRLKDSLMSDYYDNAGAGTVANFLLAMEEAHTFLPSRDLLGDDKDLAEIRRVTIDAVTKLRAMGAHFVFITQSASNFESKVVEQCSTKLFGKGLEAGSAQDRSLLEKVLGRRGFKSYASASRACGLDDAIFAVSGDLCNLRIGGDGCVVYNPIEGNITEQLQTLNPHIYGADQ